MPREITDWSQVVGNSNQKSIILNAISRNCLPNFILFTGSSGIGKSTFAKMTAKSILCRHPDEESDEPCGECPECLGVDAGESVSYRKINMPSFFKKIDLNNTVQEIFKTGKLADRTVYVLEEIHGLSKDLQSILLEELTKIPKDVWILSCTTRSYELLPEILNRALEIKLQNPTARECERFTKMLCQDYGITFNRPSAIKELVAQCDENPRKIGEVIRVVATDNHLTEEAVKAMFSTADDKYVEKYIELMVGERDLYKFIQGVQELRETVSLVSLNRRALDFLYQFAIYVATGSAQGSDIPNSVVDSLHRLFDGVPKQAISNAIVCMGEIDLRESENKISQRSKIVTAKSKIEKILARESQRQQTPTTQQQETPRLQQSGIQMPKLQEPPKLTRPNIVGKVPERLTTISGIDASIESIGGYRQTGVTKEFKIGGNDDEDI